MILIYTDVVKEFLYTILNIKNEKHKLNWQNNCKPFLGRDNEWDKWDKWDEWEGWKCKHCGEGVVIQNKFVLLPLVKAELSVTKKAELSVTKKAELSVTKKAKLSVTKKAELSVIEKKWLNIS